MREHDVLAGKRVLVVEDEYLIMDDLCRDLGKAGAAIVGPAPSVEQALDLIARSGVIDAAIVDVNLHGEMAYKVADTLLWRSIPFIFTTGYEHSMLSASYPNVPHIEKPTTFAAISRALSKALSPTLNEAS